MEYPRLDLDSAAWSTEPALLMYFNHADYAPGSPWIPSLRFRLSDHERVNGASTPGEDLFVEYEYFMDGERKRSWSPPESTSQSGHYEVPISFQHLSPDLLHSNLINTQHEIRVRWQDLAGNSGEQSFAFHLGWFSPPLVLSDCRLTESYKGYSLAGDNLHEVFSGEAVPVLKGTLDYRVGLSPQSLIRAPRVQLETGFGASELLSVGFSVTQWRNEKFLSEEGWFSLLGLSCPQESHMKQDDVWGTCNPGWYPEDAPAEPAFEIGPQDLWGDASLSSWEYSTELWASRTHRPLGSMASGTMALDLQRPATLSGAIVGAALYGREGSLRVPYEFPTTPLLETGFVENDKSRYYLDGFMQGGGDINDGGDIFAARGYRTIPYVAGFQTRAKFGYFSARTLGVSTVSPKVFRDASCMDSRVYDVLEE